MIAKLEITGVHMPLDSDIKKYINKKIGKLDKYMPRHARPSAHADIKMKKDKIKTKNEYTCEVILHMPHDTLMVKEATMNMFAAVDIVEAKLKNQLKKYKDTHSTKIHRKIIARIRRRTNF